MLLVTDFIFGQVKVRFAPQGQAKGLDRDSQGLEIEEEKNENQNMGGVFVLQEQNTGLSRIFLINNEIDDYFILLLILKYEILNYEKLINP